MLMRGFPRWLRGLLRQFGHGVLTVQEAGQANQQIPDDQVLAFATIQERAVLTVNRDDFIRLHSMSPDHAGIIVCTEDLDRQRLATRIHQAIAAEESLFGKLMRVNRPPAQRSG
ncbi:DUF5615 family PIN-like protein [Nostoc sp.]